MARLKTATRESVPEHQREAFDAFVAQRGSIPTTGPLSVMLNAPEMLARGEHLRAYLRGDESSLPENIRELAMLVTAREMDCQFIWNAHAGFGRKSGLSDDIVDCLRDKKPLNDLSTHKVSQSAFDAALTNFGVRGLTELTTLMGYYSALAFNINAFEVGLPADATEPPLPV